MADTPSADEIAQQLAQLRENYRARLPAELAALAALAGPLHEGENARTRLEELHAQLHRLAGAGGTFGLPALSAQARVLEQQARLWLTGSPDTMEAQVWHAFSADVARLGEIALNAPPPSPPPAARIRDEQPGPDQPIQIWLVEDDPDIAAHFLQQLESFNYAVRHFLRIADAEAAAQSQRPDLLIMDIMFPEQAENATQVLALRPTLRAMECPLLFVTANDDFHSRAGAARLGAEGYFLKPLDMPRLINRITQIFDKRRAPQPRVLIIDDDVALAEHARLTLLAAGMEAKVLHQPEIIIETVAAFNPELVLMDLHMPDYSGPELAGVIRQHDRWSSLPIVYLSAETDLDRQIAAMGRGADDFLTKLISDAQLVAAVRARIERARQLDAQITRDSLTGLLKHASIKEAHEIAVGRARRIGKPVTVAMLDIDHFKSVNDRYGHAVGDVVIVSLAMLLRQRLRQSDIIGRYGGEEFVAILPECDADNAWQLLEDIRQRFATVGFSHNGQAFCCTLSAGLATSDHYPDARGAELLVMADEALYVAKGGGRNQVCAADPDASSGDTRP